MLIVPFEGAAIDYLGRPVWATWLKTRGRVGVKDLFAIEPITVERSAPPRRQSWKNSHPPQDRVRSQWAQKQMYFQSRLRERPLLDGASRPKHENAHRRPEALPRPPAAVQFPWYAALPASPHDCFHVFYSVLRNQVRVKMHQPLGCCIFNQRSFALSPLLFGAAAALPAFGASSCSRGGSVRNTAIERA